MLALSFRSGEFAFVFHQGEPIGALLVQERKPAGERLRVPLLFSGRTTDFEILRPTVVERRYGKQELERLIKLFLS